MQTFESFNLSSDLLRGIYGKGWERPSDIQVRGIPSILTKNNVILQAQSGMGKTGCFSIGLLQNINVSEPAVKGVIVAPTRELATQVYNVVYELAEYLNINVMLYVGGEHTGRRINSRLMYPERATIFVGTPGKLYDIFYNNLFTTQPIKIDHLVVDEFDETLKDNFKDQMYIIVKTIQTAAQIVLCSATRNPQVDEFVKCFMTNTDGSNPIEIIIKDEEVSLEGIAQYYVQCNERNEKFITILDILSYFTVAQTIIFVNTRKDCNDLYLKFRQEGYPIDIISGDMSQESRNKVIKDFRENKLRIILATGIISRGIDVNTVSLVINYDLPKDTSEYIHRIGRTGRYGKKGLSINLITNYDKKHIIQIEQQYGIKIDQLPDPQTLNETYS